MIEPLRSRVALLGWHQHCSSLWCRANHSSISPTACAVAASNPMQYSESLPCGCPPDSAEDILEPLNVFRLVRTNPPTENDFRSQRWEKPDQTFAGISECQARGLSVHLDKHDSANARKFPTLRDRLICRLSLGPGAGRIQQTGRPSHHTWWPFADYDVLSRGTVETP